MTINERVKIIRKAKSLTLEQFGSVIGVGRSTISDIENARRNLTEHMFRSICREFDVREEWLRDGEEPMLQPKPVDEIEAICRARGLGAETRVMIAKLLDMPPEIQDGILAYMRSVVLALNEEPDADGFRIKGQEQLAASSAPPDTSSNAEQCK